MKEKSPQQNESALVCAARDGDREALRQLLQHHWLWLKALVYSILRNPDAVDEALQSICVLVIEKIATVREPERFKPWLAVVARHAALAYRQQQSKRPIQLDELLAAHQTENTATTGVLDHVARQEQYRRIMKAAGELPEKYREVFFMKYVREISYAEMAEILEVPVTTIQIRLVRARRMIQNRLTGKSNDKVPRT